MINTIYDASECEVNFKYDHLFYRSLLNNFQIYKEELYREAVRAAEKWLEIKILL